MLSYLKQLQYPKEFRIPAPANVPDLGECADEIILHFLSTRLEEKDLLDFIRELGKGIWRVRNRLCGMERPPREVESALRFLGSVFDALDQFGVQIQDHTGDRITGGEALNIISYEAVSHITQEQVIETVKPTITFKGRMIQVGEVIVGRPETPPRDELRESGRARVEAKSFA